MKAPERTTRVVWYTSRAIVATIDQQTFDTLQISFNPAAPPAAVEFEVLLLDCRAFADLDALFTFRAPIALPTLFMVRAEDIAQVLVRLHEGDDLVFLDVPPLLLSWRLHQLARLSLLQRDGLTKLRVRRAFLEQLEEVLPRAGADHPVSILLLDIDHFKAVNDQHGHAVGDTILQELAQRVLAGCSMKDFPARFSGEKMIILLEAGESEAISQAELLRQAVQFRPFVDKISLTTSVGVATANEPQESREILRQVEEALYAAKAHGRNRSVHYAELEREAVRTDNDIDLFAFENVTRVIAERVANVITRRGRRLFQEIKQQADLDSLTGLYSRRYLDRRYAFEFGETQRNGMPLTVALVDIDFFGQVNKEHGWPAGDALLKELAQLLKQNVRESDWVARYGGEEFFLAMSGTPLDIARPVLERVREAIAGHTFRCTNEGLLITVSIGGAQRRELDRDPTQLLQRVSDRLLAAKRNGRNQVCTEDMLA